MKKICLGFLTTYFVYLMIYHSGFYPLCNKWCIDKIFHVVGGYLIAGLCGYFLNKNNLLILSFTVLIFGSAWEFLEIFFLNPLVLPSISLISTASFSWGDVGADMIGCLIFWYFYLESNADEAALVSDGIINAD